MNVVLRVVRWILGQIIIFVDWVTRPKPVQRSVEQQAQVDRQCAMLALYHFRLCPFCVKVRRTMRRLALPIETRDARNDPTWHQQLIEQGGKYQVPCLRIAHDDGHIEWLYESDAINAWLEKHFA